MKMMKRQVVVVCKARDLEALVQDVGRVLGLEDEEESREDYETDARVVEGESVRH